MGRFGIYRLASLHKPLPVNLRPSNVSEMVRHNVLAMENSNIMPSKYFGLL